MPKPMRGRPMMTLGGTGVDAPIPVAVGRSHSVLPVLTDLPSSANGRCLREGTTGVER
jgi:hypothetical protein